MQDQLRVVSHDVERVELDAADMTYEVEYARLAFNTVWRPQVLMSEDESRRLLFGES